MICLRGATSIKIDSEDEIINKTVELWNQIKENNHFDNIYSIIISVTPDIKKINPATVLREKFSLNNVALMCLQEASFENSLQKIIRILVFCNSKTNNFVYLHNAKILRKDLEEY